MSFFFLAHPVNIILHACYVAGYLAHGEIFENMLQLKRFGLNFEGILNKKWLHSYGNSDINTPRKVLVD